MIIKEVKVTNKTGLHARPATIFVREASKFDSEVYITKGDKKCNAKSIMGLLAMAAAKGDTLIISAEGTDEELAVDKLVDFLNSFTD